MNFQFSNFQTKTIICLILTMVFLFSGFSVLAVENLEKICQWEKIENKPTGLSDEDYESLLKKCQDYYQERSDEIERDINRTEQEKDTLKNKIYILGNKVKNLDYQIYQGNIVIKDLGVQIKNTESSIDESSSEIERIKGNLANLLQLRYEEDQISYLEIFLAEENLSDFFDNLMALEALNEETQKLLENVKGLKTSLEGQKKSMDTEKDDLENVMTIQTIQKQESTKTKKEQESFLKMTEAEYQKYLKEKEETEKKVTEIGAKILKLVGLPEGQQINLVQAIEIAKYVETKTGIRPAFLIGLISGESALGRNVGQCYLKNPKTGAGEIIKTGKAISMVMKPMGLTGRKGDVDDFLNITKDLGRNYYDTPVSCPSPDYAGYGGAMGPAQFMPTTWVSCGYGKQVEAITGEPADPWKPLDAFLAAGLLLRKAGAAKQTYNAEWVAAVTYLHGSYSSQYDWYFKSYINPRASCVQTFIDKGVMSSDCQKLIF